MNKCYNELWEHSKINKVKTIQTLVRQNFWEKKNCIKLEMKKKFNNSNKNSEESLNNRVDRREEKIFGIEIKQRNWIIQ